MRFKKLLPSLLAFFLLPSLSWGQVANVQIGDNFFSPKNLTVPPGTTVRWNHMGIFLHTTTADDGTWNSGALSNGQSFQFTFNQLGTFPYYCAFHGAPGGIGQSGRITVCTTAKGDLNGSGTFSTSDVVLLLRCAFNADGTGTVGGDCNFCYSDVNCSGTLSASDVVLLLRWIFNLEPLPC